MAWRWKPYNGCTLLVDATNGEATDGSVVDGKVRKKRAQEEIGCPSGGNVGNNEAPELGSGGHQPSFIKKKFSLTSKHHPLTWVLHVQVAYISPIPPGLDEGVAKWRVIAAFHPLVMKPHKFFEAPLCISLGHALLQVGSRGKHVHDYSSVI